MEAAAGWRPSRAGHVARQHDPPPPPVHVDRRHRRKQGDRVGVQRDPAQIGGSGVLHDPAEVHHRHLVGDVLHSRQVVRYEEVRQAEPLAEVDEQVEHLRLDRHVERGDRLVQHDELRFEHQGPRDRDPLPLSAGELVGIALERRGGHARAVEGLFDAMEAVGRVAHAMDDEPFLEDPPHGHAGIEGAVRILEHDLHPPAERPQRSVAERADIMAGDDDPPAGRLDQAEDAATDGRLPAAALADEAERAAARDREAHAVNGPHGANLAAEQAFTDRKVRLQILDEHERFGGGRRHAGAASTSDRCGSPSRVA